ncbi:MAG: hypothetical protein GEU81_14080, partial [Nitriliruptorales bacterium]|nr:hypothetical protein [Nitriliruptorales bacterium]
MEAGGSRASAESIGACCRAADGGTLLSVRLVPRASRSQIAGVHDGAVRIRVAAPPVEGRANAALLDYLAGLLGLRPRDLDVAVGERSRTKTVWIGALDSAAVARRLAGGRR